MVKLEVLASDVLFQSNESPDVGLDCTCSRCLEPILRGIPIRMWFVRDTGEPVPVEAGGGEYRFHPKCLGFISDDGDDEDDARP